MQISGTLIPEFYKLYKYRILLNSLDLISEFGEETFVTGLILTLNGEMFHYF